MNDFSKSVPVQKECGSTRSEKEKKSTGFMAKKSDSTRRQFVWEHGEQKKNRQLSLALLGVVESWGEDAKRVL